MAPKMVTTCTHTHAAAMRWRTSASPCSRTGDHHHKLRAVARRRYRGPSTHRGTNRPPRPLSLTPSAPLGARRLGSRGVPALAANPLEVPLQLRDAHRTVDGLLARPTSARRPNAARTTPPNRVHPHNRKRPPPTRPTSTARAGDQPRKARAQRAPKLAPTLRAHHRQR